MSLQPEHNKWTEPWNRYDQAILKVEEQPNLRLGCEPADLDEARYCIVWMAGLESRHRASHHWLRAKYWRIRYLVATRDYDITYEREQA